MLPSNLMIFISIYPSTLKRSFNNKYNRRNVSRVYCVANLTFILILTLKPCVLHCCQGQNCNLKLSQELQLMRIINLQQQAKTIDNRHLDDIYHVYFVLFCMGLGVCREYFIFDKSSVHFLEIRPWPFWFGSLVKALVLTLSLIIRAINL